MVDNEVKKETRGKRLAKNTAALSIGRLSSKILVFLLVRFYTYVLTDAEYSTADLITNLCYFLIPLAGAGLSSGFFRFASEVKTDEEQASVFSSGVCILAGSTAIFLALSPLILLVPYFADYVWLIILYVLCANLHYLCSEFVRARGQFRLYAVQGLLNTMLNIAFNFIFLLPLSMGVTGYVLSILVADALTSLFLIIVCRLWRYLHLGGADRQRMKDMLRFCLPMIPAGICWWITGVSDRYMVSAMCGDTVNGLYAVAYKIPNLLTICSGIFLDAWQFSAMVEARKVKENESRQEMFERHIGVSRFFHTIFRGFGAFIFLAAGGLILFSRIFAWILFDPSFADAWKYIPLLVVATAFYAMANFVNSVYLVEKKSIPSFITAAIGAGANILLNLLLIPRYEAFGAAVATLLSYFIVFIIRLIHSRVYIPFSFNRPWLILNLCLVSALAVIMTTAPFGWIIFSIILFVLITLIDAPLLINNLIEYFRKRQKS